MIIYINIQYLIIIYIWATPFYHKVKGFRILWGFFKSVA